MAIKQSPVLSEALPQELGIKKRARALHIADAHLINHRASWCHFGQFRENGTGIRPLAIQGIWVMIKYDFPPPLLTLEGIICWYVK